VSTIISLQLAQQKWESNSARARELLDLAVGDLKEGIDELREIAVGIHPALLTQRGLATALEAMTARLAIPVRLQVSERRLPGPVEASVYFFYAEALTKRVPCGCHELQLPRPRRLDRRGSLAYSRRRLTPGRAKGGGGRLASR
jgi:hypothetical protein